MEKGDYLAQMGRKEEDYQKIYDKTIEMQTEKEGNRGR